MYYYRSGGVLLAIFVLIVIFVYLFTLFNLVSIAEDKGYEDKKALIWVIGICGTPVLAALFVAALPDKKLTERLESIHAAILSIDASINKKEAPKNEG